MAAVRVPPDEPLRSILAALEAAGMVPVIGGSAVLAARGLVDVVNDWDIVVDADPDEVGGVLRGLGLFLGTPPNDPAFADDAFWRIDAGDHAIDVMVRFRIRTSAGEIVEIPARRGSTWNDLPLARAEDWRIAYLAMGRTQRAALLCDAAG